MDYIKISEDSGADELEPIARTVHSLVGLPTTIRSLNKKGIRMERSQIVDREYTGPVLEEALRTNKVIKTVPQEGIYKGKAVIVSPIRTQDGKAIAALGIVDLVAALDILSAFDAYPGIIEEVEEAKKKMI